MKLSLKNIAGWLVSSTKKNLHFSYRLPDSGDNWRGRQPWRCITGFLSLGTHHYFQAKITAVLLIMCLSVACSFAQVQMPIDTSSRQVAYTSTIKVPNVSKEEILARAKRWMDKTYKSASSIKYEMDYGKNELRIYKVPIGIDNEDAYVFYNITVLCSDNQYQYRFFGFYHESYKGDGGALENEKPACGNCISRNAWERAKYQADLYVKILISSLESAMETKRK